jgi:hypothetical protein
LISTAFTVEAAAVKVPMDSASISLIAALCLRLRANTRPDLNVPEDVVG